MSEFLNMGGYATFVWSAIGLSVIVLLGLTFVSVRAYRRESALFKLLEDAKGSANNSSDDKAANP